MKVKIVSGYVPMTNNKRRSHAEFMVLGARLEALPFSKRVFHDTLENCWLHTFLKSFPTATFSADCDQGTMESDIIQQQKLEWMVQAVQEDTEADIFVWIDYGIMHCSGVNEECISAMLRRIEQSGSMDEIVMPGCWEKGDRSTYYMDSNTSPCWRFCGGVVICPRPLIAPFATAAKADSSQSITDTNNVGWEVNTWARVERKNILPIRWYYAGHDELMFDNYKGGVSKKTPLCELAVKWGSDKVGHHEYTHHYYNLLKNMKDTAQRVLEIGIGHPGCMGYIAPNYRVGASLYMWREFFPNAQIFGFDIKPDILFSDDRIQTFLCDQSNATSLAQAAAAAGGHFDLIVDDGSHQPAHQIVSMQTLLPHLAAHGLYIIEDIEVDWKLLAPHIPAGYSCQIIECPNSVRKCLCGCGEYEKIMVIRRNEER